MRVVLDASFAVAWVASRGGPALESQFRDMVEDEVFAPAIFWLEVASALRGLSLRGGVRSAHGMVALERLRTLDIQVDPPSDRLEATIALSDRHQLTIYDAAYLELAIRRRSALATLDSALTAAASRVGVPLTA